MKMYTDVFTLLFNDQVGSVFFFKTGDPRWGLRGWGGGGLLREKTRIDEEMDSNTAKQHNL